jgi:small GTP-binding protein
MNKLDDHIKTLRQLAANIARADYFGELDELEQKLQQGKLYLVVVGLFKRGKSSVINAILGKPLAPVAVTPVTAIITLFEYNSQKNYAAIRFKDGRIEERQTNEVSRYVNEDENPANEKQVQMVSIFDDAPILKSVSLVDTPGIGSSLEHNTTTTLQFIPKIDAALFLLSADMPISSLDSNFLKELKKSVPKIVFVMNKKDLLNDKEYKKLMRYNSHTIAALIVNTRQTDPLAPEQCDPLRKPFQKSLIGA